VIEVRVDRVLVHLDRLEGVRVAAGVVADRDLVVVAGRSRSGSGDAQRTRRYDGRDGRHDGARDEES